MGKFCVLVFCVVAAFLVAETSASPGNDLLDYLVRLPWYTVRKIVVPPCPPTTAKPVVPPAAAGAAYDEDAVAAFGFDEVESPAPSTIAAAVSTLSTSASTTAPNDVTTTTVPIKDETSEAPSTDVTEPGA